MFGISVAIFGDSQERESSVKQTFLFLSLGFSLFSTSYSFEAHFCNQTHVI